MKGAIRSAIFFFLFSEWHLVYCTSPNADHQTQKITIEKKTVKFTNKRNEAEYPKAIKKEGKYILPWETDKVTPSGWNTFKHFFVPNSSGVPSQEVSGISQATT